MTEYEVYRFPNGLRLAHRQVTHTKIAHCGFVLNIGSRDEADTQIGLAHFWEHMAFKGTQKRKAYHILSRVDSVGGELNAYTTREKICFYASILSPHFHKAAELLTDITFFSTFPEKEIMKEKGVILEEMAMYEDDPADALADEFDRVIFGEHPLGWNILGTRNTVRSFHQADFFAFIQQNLNLEEVVFSYVGPQSFKQVLRKVTPLFENIPPMYAQKERKPFAGFVPSSEVMRKPLTQAHCAIGTEGYGLQHEDRLPFYLLTNLLGGPGMNSRLNLAIREKYGFVYAIDATTTSYLDTGIFSINFATEPKTLDRCITLVERELQLLRTVKMGSMQLHRAKQQLMGQLAMSEESNLGFMLVMAKSLIDLEDLLTLNEIFEKIESVTAEKILELANRTLAKDRLSQLIFQPEE